MSGNNVKKSPSESKPRKKAKPRKSAVTTIPPISELEQKPVINFDIVLRGLKQQTIHGLHFCDPDPKIAITRVLEHRGWTAPEPRFSWQDRKIAVVIDADFHGRRKPSEYRIESVVRRLPLQPLFWWISHGGGIKLIYLATGDMSAEEIGEVVCQLLEKEFDNEGMTGTEVKTDTRHPAYPRGNEVCSRVFEGGYNDFEALKRKLFYTYPQDDIDPVAWETFLEERGWSVGQRLPHTECFIDPILTKDNCLIVNDNGIYCFRCNGKGLALPGMSVPGLMPAKYLMDAAPIRMRNPLMNCLRNFVHFEQARWHFGDIPADRAKRRYKALLRLAHIVGEVDPGKREFAETQIAKAFLTYNLIRINAMWCHTDGTPAGNAGLRDVLVSLPAAHYLKTMKKSGIVTGQDQLKCGRLQSQGSVLEDIGYYSLTKINGIDLAKTVRLMRLVPDNRILVTIPSKPAIKLREVITDSELEQAWKTVEGCFPGIVRNYLLLCIAAKGCVQQGFGIDIPRILVRGPTGAGKTQTAKLANVMGGEPPNCYKFRADEEKFQRSYFTGSLEGAMVIFDEFEKIAKRLPGEQLLEYMLFFETGARAHLLHRGEFKIEMPAGVVLTCIDIPEALLSQPEIGRRWILVDVGAGSETGADWKKTSGTSGVENWLTLDPIGTNCEARDTIVSYVYKRFFSDGYERTFEDIAKELGFNTLDKAEDSADEKYLEFLKAVRAATPTTTGRLAGYVVVDIHKDGELDRMFAQLTENGKRLENLRAVRWAVLAKQAGLRIGIKKDVDKPGRFGVKFYTA